MNDNKQSQVHESLLFYGALAGNSQGGEEGREQRLQSEVYNDYAINRSTRRFSSFGAGSDKSGGTFMSSQGRTTKLRTKRSWNEEGLLDSFKDNNEAEYLRTSEKINIQESEESKMIIEKYRLKYLKSKQKKCCTNSIT